MIVFSDWDTGSNGCCSSAALETFFQESQSDIKLSSPHYIVQVVIKTICMEWHQSSFLLSRQKVINCPHIRLLIKPYRHSIYFDF